ncbi:MAG: hypothetical protein NC253_09710 [Ruminococcus sp.]|nr:hypothetical protein [Ruminococcus sp.]MCM1381500.1 hypothetical protein [Muribaculaceae bacterium]MCM1480349.1 hypothetical protein [Muribaculaceae bacterium]
MSNNNYNAPEEKMGYNDMFSEKGLDEMYLAKKYKIGFKLFRTLFWVQYAAAFAIGMFAAGLGNDDFVYIGGGLLTIGTVFYIVYLAQLASEGLMNAKFAKSWSSIIWLIPLILLELGLIYKAIKDTDFFSAFMWLNLGAMYIGNWFCARKNQQVLEKMLKENEEE